MPLFPLHRRPRRPPGTPLRLEALEDRLVPSVATWTGDAGTNWSDAGNWREGFVPGAGDTAVFDHTADHFAATVDPGFDGELAALVVDWPDAAAITLARPLAVGSLQMNAGTIDGPFELTLGGGWWNGGTLGPSHLAIAAGGTWTIGGSDTKVLAADTDNFGAVTWTGTGDIRSGAVTIDNQAGATFEAVSDATWAADAPGGTFLNQGTFRKQESAGTTTFAIAFSNDRMGASEVASGVLALAGGGKTVSPLQIDAGARVDDLSTYTLDGASIVGDGLFRVDTDGQVFIIKTIRAENFALDAGQLGYIGNLEITGHFRWTGGTITGETDIDAGARMLITGDGTKSVKYGSPIINGGTAVWSGAGNIDLGGIWNNQAGATFDVRNHARLFNLGNGAFNNAGTVLKSADSEASQIQVNFINTGTAESEVGSLELLRGASQPGTDGEANALIIDAGASVDLLDFTLDGTTALGDGVLRLAGGGTTRVLNQVSASNVELADGVLDISAGDLSVDGSFTWVRGFINGADPHAITVGTGATLNLVGPDNRVMSGNLINDGTAYWTGTGTITISAGSALTNAPGGLFEANANAAFMSGGSFRNEGAFRRESDVLQTSRLEVTFTNTGSVEVVNGTLSLAKAFTNAGEVVVEAGATLADDLAYAQGPGVTDLRGGTLSAQSGVTVQAGGTLRGFGLVQSDVLNAGSASPGESDAAGILTITGAYTQTAEGVLAIKLSGPAEGEFDQLQVAGQATLDETGATLTVSLFDGYAPAPGQDFPVLSWAGLTGAFAQVDLPSFDGGHLEVRYDATGLTLVTVAER